MTRRDKIVVLCLVGFLVLFIAWLNFLNYRTNQHTDHIREYGECVSRYINTGEFTHAEAMAVCESKRP